MTIGPDPMMRIDWMSVRLGIAGHQLSELLEEIAGIVWAGPRFGVVLHAEGRDVTAAQAFDDTVVEVDVGDVGRGKRALDHRVVVVLARDLHCTRLQSADRVVATV